MTNQKPQNAKSAMPSNKSLEKAPLHPYSDEELSSTPEVEAQIEKLMKFFDEYGIEYGKFDPEATPKLDLDKKRAYPNNDQYTYIPGQHDTRKWLDAVKTIYYAEKNGSGRIPAIRQVTSGWNPVETFDFLNWLKFHESGDYMKYKFAQLWYENGAPGYFLHIKPDAQKEPEPSVAGKDIDFARDTAATSLSNNEKRDIIEKQRNKIIGRLDSAEKLMRTQDGQLFSGKEFESLLEAIYQLKKKIQMVNKVSSSTRLYEDMIVREANVLTRQGFVKAADVLFSVAQANNPPPPGTGTKDEGKPLSPTPPAPPAESGGAPGGLPSTGPGSPTTPPDSPNENSPVGKFLTNLETGKISSKDDAEVDDELEVSDNIEVDSADDELLVTEAQAAPKPPTSDDVPPTAPPAPKPAVEEPLEVTEDDLPKKENDTPSVSDFDSRVNQVFSNISVSDVVSKLEDLAKVFKTREIPRQLGIIDMMLDSLGLASYFPSLSEATNKALESNNYISTRVEDILSKLRGSMASNEIDLKGGDTPERPEVKGIKNNLQQSEDKEKARKQMRKDQESAELEGKTKETPEVDITEDLGAPPAAAPPKAAPKAPAAPPKPLA
jgi:hypothetical protein